ncbi:MAG TPA: hypothetical protein PLL99_02870 [Chitinophagales bacterium]|jgi:plasmid stabilization system protein ParE|nr:hypothetical protein [Chitinophagales bacterium]
MVSKKMVWDEEAKKEFRKHIKRIKLDSIQNAEKLRHTIIEKVSKIADHETKHTIDKFKQNNDGKYRAFEIYHIRIAYYIDEKEIRIVRFRSTHQEPLKY